MLAINLNDSNLWTQVWQLDVLAQSAESDDSYIRIPDQICPIILHKPVLAISVNNPLGKPGWFSAGFLAQLIRSPLIVGGNFTTHVTSRRIILGQTQIVSFLDYAISDYAVVFQPRYWHKQIQLVAWEYQGTIEQG
jgi:hypothetical protein